MKFQIIKQVYIQNPHFELSVLHWNQQFNQQLLYFLIFCCFVDSPLISLFELQMIC